MFLPILLLAAQVAAAGTFQQDEEKWRRRRVERLTSEEGWLTLVGLHWLQEGRNVVPFGEGIKREFDLKEGTVRMDGRVLQNDLTENPDKIRVGDVIAMVIQRGNRYGIRVKNPKSPVRTNFKGLSYFPPDLALVVEGKFTPYNPHKKVVVPAELIDTDTMECPGYVTFTLEGQELSLEPYLESPKDKELFYIFRDMTSGKETYPAGRFMYSDLPKDGKVTLNFNRAYNPPCAFTSFATCPLPPPRNWLKVRIPAGEKKAEPHNPVK